MTSLILVTNHVDHHKNNAAQEVRKHAVGVSYHTNDDDD